MFSKVIYSSDIAIAVLMATRSPKSCHSFQFVHISSYFTTCPLSAFFDILSTPASGIYAKATEVFSF